MPEYSTSEFCPLLQKPCIKHACKFWVHIQGKLPQSDSAVDMWDCTISWLPILLVENAQMTRQAGADVQSLRNEIVATGDKMIAHAQRRSLSGPG